MEWTPASEKDIRAMIDDGLARAEDSVRLAWETMRTEPEKWKCSPWGDAGGGFWVVGERDGQIVWYNDIEGGFNTSSFCERGTIDEYNCNQGDFYEYLLTLPEALQAEDFARQEPDCAVSGWRLTPGRLGCRKTTYWEVYPNEGNPIRIHFSGQRESRFVRVDYDIIQIHDLHPLLIDYCDSWMSLYVDGRVTAVDQIVSAVDRTIVAETQGWRDAEHYLAHGGPTEEVLSGGYGLLLKGPQSIVARVADTVRPFGVESSLIPDWNVPGPVRALLVGENFVVAESFRLESRTRPR